MPSSPPPSVMSLSAHPDHDRRPRQDAIPEHDEYPAMPRSLRHLLAPPTPDPSVRPRSILLEPSSPYSRHRRSPSDCAISRARQSVSSIGSSSTLQSPMAAPVKSILTRHDSGISMATTTKSSRRKKRRSPPSVKFVDAPTVHVDDAAHRIVPSPSPPSPPLPPSQGRSSSRWFTTWCPRRSSSPPPRPPISGPYHLSYASSLVDTYAPRQKPGRLRQLWNRLTSMLS